ncbi:MAG: hypothetical protein U0P45_03000 [Acidimicrobiales bacterium]
MSASTDAGAPTWSCRTQRSPGGTATYLTCAGAGLARRSGRGHPRLRARVTVPRTAPTGLTSWNVRSSATQDGTAVPSLAATAKVKVSVMRPLPAAKPNLSVEVVKACRGGRTGQVRVTYGNGGDAPAPAASILASFPAGVRPVAPWPKQCVPAPRAYAPAKALCSVPAGLAPSKTAASTFTVWAATNARISGTASAAGRAGATSLTAKADLVLLRSLTAHAVATPDQVASPALGDPDVTVLLDGRTSSSAEADATWKQEPATGEPLVALDGVAAGEAASGLTTSFVVPQVDAATTLHFRLTVADGTTSATDLATVTVDPAPVSTGGDDTGWGSGARAGTTARAVPGARPAADRAIARADAIGSVATGGWTSTVDPSVSSNDAGDAGPVIGSRARLLDNGSFTWTSADPEPTDTTVTHEWQQCDLDYSTDPPTPTSCTAIGTDDVLLVPQNNVQLRLHMIIDGTSNGTPVRSEFDFVVGVVGSDYGTPVVMVDPSVSGTAEVGQVLTVDPGEWTLEFGKSYQWIRCTQKLVGDGMDCVDIPGATDTTYTVGAEDRGAMLRVQVVAYGREGGASLPANVEAGQVPGSSVCTGDCWRFDTAPVVVAEPGMGAHPIAGFAATIESQGAATWLDPLHPPTNVATVSSWKECEVASPSTCTTSTGDLYVPQRTGVTLQAIVTVSGDYSVSGATEAKAYTVDLGEVQAPAGPPQNQVLPEISGTTKVGETLTVSSGTWDYAIRGSGPLGSEYGYRWYRCEATDHLYCEDTGVTSTDYHATEADLAPTSKVLKVVVTAHGLTAADDASVEVFSNIITADAKVAIAPPGFDAGGAEIVMGTTLTRNPASWSAEPQSDLPHPEVQWQRCHVAPISCEDIAGATGDSYRLVRADIGWRIRIVEHERANGTDTYSRSDPLATVDVGGPAVEATVTTNLVGGTANLPSSAHLTVTGSATGVEPLITTWQLQSGDDIATQSGDELRVVVPDTGSGTSVYRYTVQDAAGQVASTDVTIDWGKVDVPGILCKAENLILEGGTGPKTFALGSTMTMAFSNATVDGGTCGSGTTLHVTDATVTLFGWLQIAADEITIDKDGVTFAGVQLDALNDASLGGVHFHVGADLSIPFTKDYSKLELHGTVLADGLPFVSLPSGWRAAEELSFGTSGGVQTIGFHAIAFEDDTQPPPSVGTTLPTPPSGAAVLDVSGSLSSDRTFALSVSATGIVTFADSGIDFSGEVERTTPNGAVAFRAEGSLASPVDLATGVRLDSAHLAWDGTTFSGDGSLVVDVNGSDLTIAPAFSFTDPSKWSASLTVAGSGDWTPAKGIVLTDPTVTGSISRNGTKTNIAIDVDVASLGLGSKARIDDLHLAMAVACTAGSSCKPAFDLSGTLVAELPSGSTLTVTVTGSLDLGKGTFDLEGDVSGFTAMPGLDVTGAHLKVHSGGAGDRSVAFSASGVVFGTSVLVEVDFDDRGSFVHVAVGDWTPFTGAPTFRHVEVVYTSAPRDVVVGASTTVTVPAKTVWITADTVPPRWFTDLIHTNVSAAVVSGQVNLATKEFDFRITFGLPSATLVDVGGVKVTLDSVGFRVRAYGGNFSTGLEADANLRVPVMGGSGAAQLPLKLTAGYNTKSKTFSGSLTLAGNWNGAFGISGLTVRDLTVSLSMRPTGLPVVGFAGSVILPSGWASKIGLVPGTEVTLVAAIGGAGGTSSCFGFEIGKAGSTSTVLDVANAGALTAKHASIYFAPTGCQVGPFQIASGLSLDFDGTILSTPVRVQATISPTPLNIDADISIGAFSVGGFTLDGAHAHITISSTQQRITFDASASLFGATAKVQGLFARGSSGVLVDFTGEFTTPDLGGFQLDRLTLHFRFTSGPPSTITVDGAALLKIMGQPQSVALSMELVNGAVTKATGDVAISVDVPPIAITGNAHVVLQRGQFPQIAIDGSLTAGGRQLTAARLLVQANGISVSASVNIPGVTSAPVVLSGTIAWRSVGSAPTLMIQNRFGQMVAASPGDFRFDATGINISVSGFSLSADVTIARVQGTFWADIATGVQFGVDSSNVRIGLRGSFASNGDFSLAGVGAITLGGIPVTNATFSFVHQGASMSLGVSTALEVPSVGSISFSGSFSRTSGGTFFELTGTGSVRPGGYDFGYGTFTVFRRQGIYGPYQGISAAARVSVPGLATGDGTLYISSDGTASMSLNLGMNGNIGAVMGYPTASVNFSSGFQDRWTYQGGGRWTYGKVRVTELSFSASIHDAMKIPGWFTVSGTISPGNSFDLYASVGAGPWSWSKDVGICTARASAQGTFSAHVSGGGNSLSIDVTLDASASAGCGKISVSVGASLEFSYTSPNTFSAKVKLRIHVKGIGTWNPTVATL